MYTLRSLIVLVALLGVFAPAVEAKERPMLAVLDFASGGAELTQEELSLLSDVSRATARRVLGTAYTIITQESIEQLLKAHGKTLEQCQGECETEKNWVVVLEALFPMTTGSRYSETDFDDYSWNIDMSYFLHAGLGF